MEIGYAPQGGAGHLPYRGTPDAGVVPGLITTTTTITVMTTGMGRLSAPEAEAGEGIVTGTMTPTTTTKSRRTLQTQTRGLTKIKMTMTKTILHAAEEGGEQGPVIAAVAEGPEIETAAAS